MFAENNNLNEEKIAENLTETEAVLVEEALNETKTADFSGEKEEPQEEPIDFSEVLKLSPEQLEKEEVKRVARAVGISFLVFYGIMWLLNVGAIFIARIFASSFEEAMDILYEPAILQLQQIIFSLSVFTLPFIFIFKLYKYRISDLLSFEAPKGKKSVYLFLIGISFCSFANIAASLAERVFDRAGISYEVDFGDNPNGVFGFLLSLIATAIVPALVEEFACRGILLGALKKHGEAFAIITSSTLFGLMHSNFEQIPFAFLVGLVLGYITIKSGSIWIAVAVHCFNNSVSVVYTYLLSGLSGVAQNISYTVFLILCLLAGLFAITRLTDETNIFKFNADTSVTGINTRLKWFFLSVPIIIYASICILQSLTYFN